MNEMIDDVDIIGGMDVISQLGGVTIYENGTVEFRVVHCVVSMQPTVMTHENSGTSPRKIKDKNFSASFDSERWIVE